MSGERGRGLREGKGGNGRRGGEEGRGGKGNEGRERKRGEGKKGGKQLNGHIFFLHIECKGASYNVNIAVLESERALMDDEFSYVNPEEANSQTC